MLNKILETLFPDNLYCNCCGKAIDWTRPYGLCDTCMRSIHWANGRLCEKCGKILSINNPDSLCYNCKASNRKFNKGYTCTEYGAHDRALIYALKYDEKPAIARKLGEIMADRMLQDFTPDELRQRYDLVVPVPLAGERYARRGYNQAALLSKYFAARVDLPYYGEVLFRVRETAALKGLSPSERRDSLRGSFEVNAGCIDLIRAASILLIDDISTTGATADEISQLLYNNGARQVDFLSFASGADVIKS